ARAARAAPVELLEERGEEDPERVLRAVGDEEDDERAGDNEPAAEHAAGSWLAGALSRRRWRRRRRPGAGTRASSCRRRACRTPARSARRNRPARRLADATPATSSS